MRKRCGFTLIELLVVVAIIALLIGLLVPALGRARDVAQTVACSSNQRQLAIAMISYTAEWDDYIPGPNTSGANAVAKGTVTPNESSAWRNPTRPISKYDWMSPILGNFFGGENDVDRRLRTIFNDQFRCPSNDAEYNELDFYPGDDRTTPITQNSYSAPYTMHKLDNTSLTVPSQYRDLATSRFNRFRRDAVPESNGGTLSSANQEINPNRFGPPADQAVSVTSSGHVFRTSTLGTLSFKVAVMEGSRFAETGTDGRVIEFSWDQDGHYGDIFMNRGPGLGPWFTGNGNPYRYNMDVFNSSGASVLSTAASEFSYRHANDTMTLVFFDGHAEILSEEETRPARLWWPSGSTVVSVGSNNAGSSRRLADLTLENGDTID
ncbi:MAG: type II secretion system protein [Planctomycetota bacterium]